MIFLAASWRVATRTPHNLKHKVEGVIKQQHTMQKGKATEHKDKSDRDKGSTEKRKDKKEKKDKKDEKEDKNTRKP